MRPRTGRSLLRDAHASVVQEDADAPDTGDAPDEATAAAEPTDQEPSKAAAAAGSEDSSGADDPARSEGVDTEHVMNLTFVLTLLFGVPTVVVLSLFVPLDGWGEIISFVVRVGAGIWFVTAVALYVRERRRT